MTIEIAVGKERYNLFKKRYYIKIDNVTTYYYSEYIFWKEFFKMCEEYQIGSLDRSTLGFSIDK